jgi:hypothetical protein
MSTNKRSTNFSTTLGTGGGPAKKTNSTITDTEEIIKEIIGDQLTGRTSKYNSDTVGRYSVSI